jgi:hypothetical protein
MGRRETAVTKLVVAALDAAGIPDGAWHSRLKIGAARLARLRSGHASLTEAELNRISRATGEPWQNLVLGLLGGNDPLTADSRELVSALHSLKQTADAEAKERGKRRDFSTLRQLMQKKSA